MTLTIGDQNHRVNIFLPKILREEMNNLLTVKDRVQELCEKRGISIYRLEKELGLGQHTIQKWGKAKPNTESLTKVSEYFGVSVDYLLTGEDTPMTLKPTLRFALKNGDRKFTDEQIDEVESFMNYVYERDRQKNEH